MDPGHFFVPMGKTYPSYSSWAVTVSLSVIPYRKQLKEINTATLQLSLTADSLTADLRTPANASDPNLATLAISVQRLSRSIGQLKTEGTDLSVMFSDLLFLSDDRTENRAKRNSSSSQRPRAKRGLINGIGSVMSSLFGTATESEIQHLAKNVRLINAKEVAMAHAFNGTLNVINATRVSSNQNRKALRTLSNAIQSMTESHRRLIHTTRRNTETLSISLHVADLSESINQVTRTVHHLRSSLSSLSDKFALAQAGILHTDLISSRDLGRVLRRISKALPTNFALPYPLTRAQDYIRVAKTKLLRFNNSYHVLFYVPLLHTLHAFNIYRFFPYQVPLLDHNVSLSYVPTEPRFLLVSENRQQYIQPSDSEMESCILENHPFCQIHEPAYSTAGAASCIVSLFRLERPAIEKYCAPVIRPTNDAPKAYYLADGKWLIVSRPPTRLTIVCPRTTRSLTVKQVVEVVTLALECSATGDSLYLPPYYASETHLDLPEFEPILLRYLVNDTDTVLIWRPKWTSTLQSSLNLTALPPLHVNGMPADDYFNKVEAIPLEQVFDNNPADFSRSCTLIIIIGIVAIALLGCVIRNRCPRSREAWRLPRFHGPPTDFPPSDSPVMPPRVPQHSPEPPIELRELPRPSPPSPSARRSASTRVAFSPCPAHDSAPLDSAPRRGAESVPLSESASLVFGEGSAHYSRVPLSAV